MATRRQDRRDFDVQRAAYLCAERELTQAEIGRMLGGLSQSRVSRLLKYAEDRGWLERSYRFVPDRLPPGRYAQLRRLDEPSALIDLLASVKARTGVHVSGVHVVDTGSSGTSDRAMQRRFARFRQAVVGPLDDLLLRSDCVAVSWGRSVMNAIEGLRDAANLKSAGRSIRVVPVCGEPLAQATRLETSTHLAERLHQTLHSKAPEPPSLTGVPALIPRHLTSADARAIRKFLSLADSYCEVFGAGRPLIDQVDTLLTSVGAAKQPMGFVHAELLKAGGTRTMPLTSEQLAGLVCGDIGGVLLPRPDLDARGRREVESLNRMWTGANLSHYERIAKAAQRLSRPGIVVLSIGGPGRAEVIAEAVRHGLVNELIIDRVQAEALTKAIQG